MLTMTLGFLTALVLVLWVPVRVVFRYQKVNIDDLIHIRVTWLGMWSVPYTIPMVAFGSEAIHFQVQGGQKEEANLSLPRLRLQIAKILRYLPRYLRLGRRLYGGMRFEELVWRTRFGTPDAAETALAVGALWGFKGMIVGNLTRLTRFVGPPPQLRIDPMFNPIGGKMVWETDLTCRYRFRLSHVLYSGYRMKRDLGMGRKSKQKGGTVA